MSQTILSNLAFQPIAWGDGYDSQGNLFTPKSVWTGQLNTATSNSYLIDFTQSNQMIEDQRIQSVYYMNPTAQSLVLSVLGTNFTVRFPTMTYGLVPIICSDRPQITLTTSANSGIIQAWFLNVNPFGAFTSSLGS